VTRDDFNLGSSWQLEEENASDDAQLQEEVRAATEALSALIKALKVSVYYPAQHPITQQFRTELVHSFTRYFEQYEALIVEITEQELLLDGTPVLKGEETQASMAFLLYKDGMRELRLYRGTEEWEILALTDIIAAASELNQSEDDLVTLLWEREFIHVDFLAIDDVLDDAPLQVPDSLDQFRQHLLAAPAAHQVEVEISGGLPEEPSPESSQLDASSFMAVATSDLQQGIYTLSAEEIEQLRLDIEEAIAPHFVLSITDIFFDIFALENERGPFEDAAIFLQKCLDALVTLGEFRRARDLLRRVVDLTRNPDLPDWQHVVLHRIVEEAGQPTCIERIGRILEKESLIRLDDLKEYLMLLDRNAIPALTALLGDLHSIRARWALCDALAEISRDALDLLAPYLSDSRWFVVRNISYVLGQIRTEACIAYLQRPFAHPDARVRREAVRALGLIGSPRTVVYLMRALQDDDSGVRSLAAVALGKVGAPEGVNALLQLVQSRGFAKRDPAEVQSVFDGIGLSRSSDAVPVLRDMLTQRRWFSGQAVQPLRIGAAKALAKVDTPEARSVLDAALHAADAQVRQACEQALSQHRLRPGESTDDQRDREG
jgi:HEAT repeat protein